MNSFTIVCCRFFIETIAYLRDNATIELFFLQSKQAVYVVRIDSLSKQYIERNSNWFNQTHNNVVIIKCGVVFISGVVLFISTVEKFSR